MKNVISTLVFSAAVLALVGCSSKKANTVEEAVVIPQVKVAEVVMKNVAQQKVYTGNVEADVVNNIAPSSPKRIHKIMAEVGDHVKKGQVLVTLDDSYLIQAKVQLENARKEYERTNELYEFGGVSKSEWDARRMQLDVAEASYNNMKENTVLVSPINGIVTARNYDNGDLTGNLPVFVVEQVSPLKIVINVSESFFTYIKKGLKMDVELDAYPGKTFTGTVKKIVPVVDNYAHTFKVELALNNSKELIRSGMYARVTFTYATAYRPVVPDFAVQKLMGSGDRYVYVYNEEDQTVAYKKVEIGSRQGDQYEIISGVGKGDKVVVDGYLNIKSGQKVELVK